MIIVRGVFWSCDISGRSLHGQIILMEEFVLSCDISVSSMCSHLIYVGGVRVVM